MFKINQKRFWLGIVCLGVLGMALLPKVALAACTVTDIAANPTANCPNCDYQQCTDLSITRGLCTWIGPPVVTPEPGEGCLAIEQQLGFTKQDLVKIVYDIVRYLLGLAGLVATIVIIIGGYYWMTAAGNEERVGKAKKLIYGGIIGLAIVILAYAILVFVVGMIMGAPTA